MELSPDDVERKLDAIEHSLETAMRRAELCQADYMVVPMDHLEFLHAQRHDYEPPWPKDTCYAAGPSMPHDGRHVVLCLLTTGHRGECGGHKHLPNVDRSTAALTRSPLVVAAFVAWFGGKPKVPVPG